MAGERKKDSAVWDRGRPARKGEKAELTRTQQADRQILGTDDDGFSRFFRALFQFSKRAAGEAAKFGRSGVELLGVVCAA